MIIKEVDLRGFGCLCDRVFRFSSGFNIVVGPNEAGKSTLLQAIQTLLYGHFVDSGVWAGGAVVARLRPWSGALFAGTLHVCLANSEQFRIERRFDDERTTVWRDPRGIDVTDTYGPGPHGWVDFADRQLGLTPAVFRASACIRQEDLGLDSDDVKVLHSRLKALADSGGTDQSAEDATRWLEALHKRRVNPHAHVVENSPLKCAEATVRDLRDRLQQSRVALEDLAASVADALRYAEVEAGIRGHLQPLDALIAWHQAEVLDAKLRRLADIDRRMTDLRADIEGSANAATLTTDSLAEATHALAEASQLQVEVERLTAQARQEDEDRTQTDRNLTTVAEEMNRLPSATQASPADFAEAQSAVDRWQTATNQSREAADSLVSIQRRRAEAEANRDARLIRLPHLPIDELQQAVGSAMSRRTRLDVAKRRVADHPAVSKLQEAYHALEIQLGALSADELTRMRALETDLSAAERRRLPGTTIPLWLGALVGITLALSFAFFLLGAKGAAGALVALGPLAYLAYSFVQTLRMTYKSPKNRVLLDRWLSEYSVRSLDELQGRWDHRPQLQAQLAEARLLQLRFEEARRDYASSLDDLERLTGVRAVDVAQQILDLAVDWMRRQSELDQTEKDIREVAERARREENEAQSVARTVLDRLGIASDDPIQARGNLDRMRSDRERRVALAQRKVELQADLDRYEWTLQLLDERQSQLAAAEGFARERLAAVGVAGEARDWASDLAERRERFEAYRDAVHTRGVQEQLRQALVGSENSNEWQPKLRELRSAAVRPEDSDARTLDNLRQEAQRLRGDLDAVRIRLDQVEARRQERLNGLVEPAEVEEKLADATAALAKLQHLSNVLQEARSLIKIVTVAHRRNFAPRLGELVSSSLDRATNHRYARADVAPTDLSVKLASRERGGLVGLDQVSHGTRDAVAVLFRASVVDLLGNPSEPSPLFLDDPLVHVDPDRIQSILDILCDLAGYRQIIYFTQDPRIVEWVARRGECCVHRLAAASE